MVCVLASTLCFSTASALIRGLSGSVPPPEIAFFRSFFGLLILLPVVGWYGASAIRTERLALHGIRGALHAVSMIIWFFALSLVPLAEATALEFAAPLMTTMIAILFLGEVVRARRLAALAIGIAGVLIVVRPGFESVALGQLLCLVSVVIWAACQLIIRELGRTESAFVQGFYTVAVFTPITAAVALPFWVWPSPSSVALLVVLAAVSTVGIWLYGEAFRRAEMSAILPLESTKLIWSVGYGLIFFAEEPELLTLAGGAIIFAAAAYITFREALLSRQAAPPTSDTTGV